MEKLQQRTLGLRHTIAQECRFVTAKKSSPFYNSWPPAGVIMNKAIVNIPVYTNNNINQNYYKILRHDLSPVQFEH